MLRLLLSTISTLGFSLIMIAQQNFPEFDLTPSEVKVQMEFLASDFLRGRRTGSPGNDIAAAYIASHLRAYGYATPPGQTDYYQQIPFAATQPPVSSGLSINKQELAPDDFLILSGGALNFNGKGVFAGHGWVDSESGHDDYASLDVKGKVVFVLPGEPGRKDPQSIFKAMPVKRELAYERGAVALIEMYQLPFPWAMFSNFFGGETLRVDENETDNPLVYGWLNKTDALTFEQLQTAKKLKVALNSSGFRKNHVYSNNVMGILSGTDPTMRDEYILLSAHFDHVGVGKQGGQQYTEQDSIFNGARDNAFGTAALLSAAKALALKRPKRSVIILAVTGEELGLLGSAYYVDHPLIPLEKTIFNLNTDGAGYSDTTVVSLFGWSRTGVNEAVETALNKFNLGIVADPAPEQNLFDRSDNVSFARKGVPALSFSPGFKEFDSTILANYHQVTDEIKGLDFNYVTKYCQAFAHTARAIANMTKRPQWVNDDKYEEAGKKLYGEER